MLKGTILTIAAIAAACGPVGAAAVQPPLYAPGLKVHTIEDRWQGAWVVTAATMYSECNGNYTDNSVTGGHVSSRGHNDIPAGTPGHVDAVSVSRGQIVLSMTASQQLLVTRAYGDRTLQGYARCQVDLKVLMPPGMAEHNDIAGTETLLRPILRPFPDENSALLAAGFQVGDPAASSTARDNVLAGQRRLEERRDSQAIDARVNQWVSQTARIPAQISNDPDYLDGFAHGVEAGRATPAAQCADLVSTGPGLQPGRSGAPPASYAAKGSRQKAWVRGYEDGLRLTQGLEAISTLPQCAPATPSAAAR
jgi:hypothetical protein